MQEALVLINLVTSTITGITGFGGGMILVGLMPFFLPATAIVPIHGATQLASNISRAWFGRKYLDLTYLFPYCVGAVVGVVIFWGLVRFINLDIVPLLMAMYLLLTQWSKTVNRLLSGIENFYVIGCLQTGIGLFVGATGPLHMPLLMKQYDNPHVLVTTASLMISLVHLIKIVVYLALGFVFLDYWRLIAMMIVVAVIGSWLGVQLRHHISMVWLKKVLPWLLTVIAIKILLDTVIKLEWCCG